MKVAAVPKGLDGARSAVPISRSETAVGRARPPVEQVTPSAVRGGRNGAAAAQRNLTLADRVGARAYADQQDRWLAWSAGNRPVLEAAATAANVSSAGGGAARSTLTLLDVRL